MLKALKQYDGTILFVSHDHEFINKLSNRVIELTPTGVHSYHGNYDLFLQQKRDSERLLKKAGSSDSVDSSDKSGSSDKEDHEQRILRLDNAIKYLEINNPSVAQELQTIKKSLCPHTYTCLKNIAFQANRKIYIYGIRSTVITFGLCTLIGGGGIGSCVAGMVFSPIAGWITLCIAGDHRRVTLNEKAIHKHTDEETQKIDLALKKAEPVILGKAEKQPPTIQSSRSI